MAQDDKTRANALIDKYDGYLSSLDVKGLCDELSQTVMSFTYTVFQVFEVMSERGYSQTALEQVATGLIDRINPANLIELAKSMHGTILLNRVQYLMNCEANPNQTVCQHIAVGIQRANEKLREEDKKKPNDTGQIRQLTEEEIQYYKAKVPKGGKFKDEIVWELPNSGIGYTVYNPNDIAADGLDQIGTLEIVEAMIAIAAAWAADPNHSKLQYGDISRAGGLKFSKTAGHHTHKVGLAFDMRILRKDKAMLGLTISANEPVSSQYDREANREFINFVKNLYPETTVYFNDPVLIRELSIVENRPGHWHHLHVMPYLKGREQ